MTQESSIPVIALDGPTASGKGTVAMHVASRLGWHVLDSGAIYRLAALAVINAGADPSDLELATEIASQLQIRFDQGRIFLSGADVTDVIRQERVGNLASELAKHAGLREELLARQRAFRVAPGLVADGRDMGTVVFTDSPLKIFLLADVHARAQRRYQQMIQKGQTADYETVLQDLKARDERDTSRAVAPLKPAADAHVVDSSSLTIDQTVQRVLDLWAQCGQGQGAS